MYSTNQTNPQTLQPSPLERSNRLREYSKGTDNTQLHSMLSRDLDLEVSKRQREYYFMEQIKVFKWIAKFKGRGIEDS
jgi:ATP-dependent Lon protease